MRLWVVVRRAAALLLALPLLGCLLACAGTGREAAGGGTLEVCLAARPASLDPQLSLELDAAVFARHLFEGLTRPAPDGSGWTGGAAEDCALSPDGLTATFFLRDDAVWSDGLPVVAGDFVYAWNRLFRGEERLYAWEAAQWIEGAWALMEGEEGAALGVRALDDKTLEVRLTAPCAFLDALMALPILVPLRREQAQDTAFGAPEGGMLTNGAYTAAAEADGSLALERNAAYWDRGSAMPERIRFRFVGEAEGARAVRAGSAQLSAVFPEDERGALAREGLLAEAALAGSWYVAFNCAAPPFDDENLRRAFALAIDAEAVAGEIRTADAVAADALIPPGSRDAQTGAAFYAPGRYALPAGEAREQAAKRALARAGYSEGAGLGAVEFLVDRGDADSGLADALCRRWRAVLGVEVRMVTADRLDIVNRRCAGEFQLARATFVNALGDPLYMLDAELTMAAYEGASAEYAAHVGRARRAREPAARREALIAAEGCLLERAVYAPVLFYRQAWVQARGLEGVEMTPEGELLLFGAHEEASSRHAAKGR